jgi:inner membrane transporter RhtA
MNACFYLAIARIPLATVGAMEFLGPVALAALGTRTRRNAAALGHRIAASGGAVGIDRLATAILIAAVAISPAGITSAAVAFTRPVLLGAGCGVGICSSVIPYVTDQLAMARLPRAAFALLMSLLPASAAVIGVIVLHQLPGPVQIAGIILVAVGVALRAETSG